MTYEKLKEDLEYYKEESKQALKQVNEARRKKDDVSEAYWLRESASNFRAMAHVLWGMAELKEAENK